MILTIASGKGGTGKTTLAVNLTEFLMNSSSIKENIRLLDCDVEAPNDNLFIKASPTSGKRITIRKPVWNKEKCKACGKCKEVCRYNAIAKISKEILIFKDLCHSCGGCKYICPNDAITEEEYSIGEVYATPVNQKLLFAYGLLNIGKTTTPSMVKAVKSYISLDGLNIIDAPPGTGCSVVSTLEGSDIAILVTEPTPFGLHDLKLALELANKMKIPTGVVINRSDGNDNIILDFLNKYDIPVLGRIPFDRKYAEAYSRGEMLIHSFPEIEDKISKIFAVALELKDKKVKQYTTHGMNELNYTKSQKNISESTKAKNRQKEIMIISGKGGTGKTTITAALSVLAKRELNNNRVFADCDVDAADLHLLLKPEIIKKSEFSGGSVYKIDSKTCIGCGKCEEHCRFDAVKTDSDKFKINEFSCEGCGVCTLVCSVNAISEKAKINGHWFISNTENGEMVHARLGIAEENSGKLVSIVRDNASKLAKKTGKGWILGDGPPGIGCPVIASITGIDLALIITEPTVSGIHDMERTLDLVKHFKIQAAIIINKADLNIEMTEKIKYIADLSNAHVIAEIPFDRNVNDALVTGKTIIEYGKGKAYKEIERIWDLLLKML
ncbi:MAG: P-loop NTPase [Lentisphaerae bacterium]|nr:P-loop NTPase [Lentisphaerota bacterium]